MTSVCETQTCKRETQTCKRDTQTCKRDTQTCKRETQTCKRETQTCKRDTQTCKRETQTCKSDTQTCKHDTQTGTDEYTYIIGRSLYNIVRRSQGPSKRSTDLEVTLELRGPLVIWAETGGGADPATAGRRWRNGRQLDGILLYICR